MPKTNEQLYEEAERQLIGEAIAETEQEIHDSAFDNAPDDNDGDTSLEEMDSDDVVDDDIDDEPESDEFEAEDEDDREPAPEAKDQDQAPVQADRAPSRGIPSSRLREEADARRTAEAEREAARAELRELRARIEAQERAQRQPQQQAPQQQGPDMFADPDGWANAQRQQIRNEFRTEIVNMSFAAAMERQPEKWAEAWQAINAPNPTPEQFQAAQRIWNSPNPGTELLKWHDTQTLMRDIGSDPAAYRQKLRDELLADPDFRKELISGMRQDATTHRRTNVQLPPSLNGASGGTSHRGRDSRSRDTAYTTRSIEKEIADSVWDD